MDVKDAERSSSNGSTAGKNEQPPDLLETLYHLALELRQTNELLTQVVAQNADLMQMVCQGEEQEQEQRRDLAGRPI